MNRYRQVAALLALVGLMESVYLTLYHYGYVGTLACAGAESCEKVQASRYAMQFGIPVALYGVAGYLVLLVTAMAGLQGRGAESATPSRIIALLSGIGVAFSLYLTYLELFVIHAICKWCVGSAIIITLIFVVSLLSLRTRPSASPRP